MRHKTKNQPMLIQKYRKSWVKDFNELSRAINEVLVNLNVSVEHIGSTSIPGLAAKPIIDIDIVFGKNVEFDQIKVRLEKIGYYHKGNQGIHNREVFKRNHAITLDKILDAIVHHLYVCPADSEELQRHILFRNYLTSNEAERIKYQNLKHKIAEEVNQDQKKYAQLKEVKAGKFINEIIEKAKISSSKFEKQTQLNYKNG